MLSGTSVGPRPLAASCGAVATRVRAAGGQAYAARQSLEQLTAELQLASSHLMRQRRLGHPQALGRAGERALLCNATKYSR